MTLEGGLRDRMIHESVLTAIETDLTTRGWFAAGRYHGPITVIDEYPDDEAEVALNTLAVSMGDGDGLSLEMGSTAEEHDQAMFVDFYAESDALGRHVSGDIYAFLKKVRRIQVFDFSVASPTAEFFVQIEEEDVIKRRGATVTTAWKKHWYVVAFTVTDGRDNA